MRQDKLTLSRVGLQKNNITQGDHEVTTILSDLVDRLVYVEEKF